MSTSRVSYYPLVVGLLFFLAAVACGFSTMTGTGTEVGNVFGASIGVMALGMGVMFIGISLNPDCPPMPAIWVGALLVGVGAITLAHATGTLPFTL